MFVNTGISFDIAGALNKKIGKGMTFRFIVDNLFDTKPPFPVPADGGVGHLLHWHPRSLFQGRCLDASSNSQGLKCRAAPLGAALFLYPSGIYDGTMMVGGRVG